jgi:aspartate aminotransferase
MDDLDGLRTILYSSQILSGWAMASALMQHSLADLDRLCLDVEALQRRRDRFVGGLRECGYEVRLPEGAFYLTPKSPIPDDVAFADVLASKGVLCLPGSIVKMNGYLRLSLTATDAMIERALPVFAAARRMG